MTDKEYQDCLESMYRLHRFGIVLGLDTISTILKALDEPHKKYQSIHIAGTNGKGSVAAMLTSILQSAGYTVGCYTSPHLEKFNERISINNRHISDQDVIAAYRKVQDTGYLSRQPTFFEITTAMALWQFGNSGVDWTVIETGMGGRLDATNVISPALSIITNISLEHRAYLGNTIAAIASEKAGIIKSQTPIITGAGQTAARNAICLQAAAKNAPVYLKGRDFRTRRHGLHQVSYYGIEQKWRHLDITLRGRHQMDNTALVLAACETLQRTDHVNLTLEQIQNGLKRTQWPGRLEILDTKPCLMLDGAHNLTAARALARFLSDEYKKGPITLVVGILDDKPYHQMLATLAGPCSKIVLTQPKTDRALPTHLLFEIAKTKAAIVEVYPDVAKAVRFAINTSAADETICVAGSLYVVGEARTALKEMGLLKDT